METALELNADVSATKDKPEICDCGCGQVIAPGKAYLLAIQIHYRGDFRRVRRFVSAEHRRAWWTRGGGDSNFESALTHGAFHDVYRPDTLHQLEGRIPVFFCSHDPAHAEHAPLFDRDLLVTVFEQDPGQARLRLLPIERGIDPTHAVEQWRFSCPCEFNDWHNEPISLEEHAKVRADFQALKSAA